jgi:hypothetical protein
MINTKNLFITLTLLAIGSLGLSACDNSPTEKKPPQKNEKTIYPGGPVEFSLISPKWAADTSWLALRAEQQAKAISNANVFHDFSLTDKQADAGITFRYKVVNDASITYKAVHYDHGSGVAIADVDGDGDSDIYFPNQVGANGMWRNNGDATFNDITDLSGVAVADRISIGAAFADIDNDGDPDLFVTTVKGGNILFENDGTGNFTDISAEAGVNYIGHSSGAVFFDYDNDGLLDLYVTNVGTYTNDEIGTDGAYEGLPDAFTGHTMPERFEGSILYHNTGGNKFEDVTSEMGIENLGWSGDAAPIDANNDGWIDLYVLSMQGLDSYFENQAGKGFINKSAEVFPRSSWGAMGVQVFDYDNDGDQDIYVTDMHSDMAEQVRPLLSEEKRKAHITHDESFHFAGGNAIWGNSFFRNEGDGSFTEISDEINAENFWPWGLSAGDLNADGNQDVFIASSMSYPWRYGINSVLLNNGSSFVDAEFAVGAEPRSGAEFVPWFELDCAGTDKAHRDCPKDFNAGRVIVNGSAGSRSSVIFDYDADGDLDIITSEFGTEPLVLQSNLTDRTKVSSIRVDLSGTTSNRSGLGATVTVKAGDASYTRVMDGRTGYLGQSDAPLYFGLGTAQAADSITVKWPSGTEQTIPGPITADNQLVEIVEPE